MSSVNKLQRLKKTIQDNKEKSDRLNGQLDSVKKNLKDAGYKNLKEAKVGLNSLEQKSGKLRGTVEKKLTELEDKVHGQTDS